MPKHNALSYPPYILNALATLRPPEKLTVSEWADKYRVLSAMDSAAPGQWRTAKTPYLKGVMDAFCNPNVQDITFCAGAQVGKTAAEHNMIGYAIAQDPAPMLVVYPTDKLAKSTSEKRLQPLFQLSPVLREKFREQESQDLELTFSDMYIALVGANSPSGLSSRPIRYVFFDEIDKFPRWSGQEAGPLELAAERTKTYYNRKIVKVSTPTLKTGNIWQGWENADIQYRYFVPCPCCGEYQTLEFRQIKYPDDADETEARVVATYECKACHGVIDDRAKPAMLRLGEWRGGSKVKGKARKVAYHLSSLYSPWVSFGDVAAKYLASKHDPALLMNFVNSWLAEPWEDKASRLDVDIVLNKALPYERGRLPSAAQLLTVGIDVQLDCFYYAVRAWGAHLTSWLVDWGCVEDWADLLAVINRNYADEQGELHQVNLACVDSGYNTDDVYSVCAAHMDVMVPTKGLSVPLRSRYNITVLDKRQAGFGLRLYGFDPNVMKDFLASRMGIAAGARGSWNVYRGIEIAYAEQICAEQRVERKDKKGRIVTGWEKISSHAANHLLDCETNNVLAAEILGVRYLEDTAEDIPPEDNAKKDDWLGVGDNWLAH